MGEATKIQWTHHTFNPWWGCQRVSPGCVHCYAETFDKRIFTKDRAHWGAESTRRFFGDKHWNEPLKWNREAIAAGERRRVFCASMADVFENRDDLVEPRARLFRLIEATPGLDWMLLTKRPENVGGIPMLQNVWMGTTVEDVERKSRIEILRTIPATTRFLSIEPLLEDLGRLDLTGIHLAIVGGESGGGARRFDVAWARRIKAQCRKAGTAFFLKQLGTFVVDRNDAGFMGDPDDAWDIEDLDRIEHDLDGTRDGYQGAPVRIHLKDHKGGDMTEWPIDLRVRQFPGVGA